MFPFWVCDEIQIQPINQHFPVVPFIVQYKVVLLRPIYTVQLCRMR